MTCSDYNQATTTQEFFTDLLGEENYHPLFVSVEEDSVCFVVEISTSSYLSELQSQDSIRFVFHLLTTRSSSSSSFSFLL